MYKRESNQDTPVTSEIDIKELLQGLVSANTIYNYGLAWRKYLTFAKCLDTALSAQTLAQWRAHLINEDGYSVNTINQFLHGVRTIVKQLYLTGKAERNIYHDMLEVSLLPANALMERRRPNNRTKIEPEQMRKLVKLPPVSAENDLALRDRALLMTLATTGCRISEVINIKFRDIKSTGASYVVTNILGKGQSQTRTAPLSSEAYEAICDWIAFRPINSPYVFTGVTYADDTGGILYHGEPLKRNTAGYRVKMYGAQIGLPDIKPHDFRRFVGTQIIRKAGIRSAQKVLGHANINTTAKYYDLEELESGISEGLF